MTRRPLFLNKIAVQNMIYAFFPNSQRYNGAAVALFYHKAAVPVWVVFFNVVRGGPFHGGKRSAPDEWMVRFMAGSELRIIYSCICV